MVQVNEGKGKGTLKTCQGCPSVLSVGDGASNQLQLGVCIAQVSLAVWTNKYAIPRSGDGEPSMEVAHIVDTVVAKFIGTKHERDLKKLQPWSWQSMR